MGSLWSEKESLSPTALPCGPDCQEVMFGWTGTLSPGFLGNSLHLKPKLVFLKPDFKGLLYLSLPL